MGNILEVSNLQAGYGKLMILHDLSMEFRADGLTAILGPNGSGKSTLLKSIVGLATVFDGSIRMEGQELIGQATEAMGQHGIAYVPQRENIFSTMTVNENLSLAARQLGGSKRDYHLQQVRELFPLLGKRKNQRANQLSGGERQMLAIAISWLSQPRLMLLDEPTAGLAPIVATEVFEILQQLSQQGVTMVVVEQNARRLLRWCDWVYVLREGVLAFTGTAEECLNDEEMLKDYLGIGPNPIFSQ